MDIFARLLLKNIDTSKLHIGPYFKFKKGYMTIIFAIMAFSIVWAIVVYKIIR